MYERIILKRIFKHIGWQDLDWTNLAQGMALWWALGASVMVFLVPLYEGSTSTS
jgi:hypothetical protein